MRCYTKVTTVALVSSSVGRTLRQIPTENEGKENKMKQNKKIKRLRHLWHSSLV